MGHSFFLSNRGMKVLEIFAPKSFAKTLRTTVYATIASIQLILLFTFWNFSGVFIWQIETPASLYMIILNLISLALLSISVYYYLLLSFGIDEREIVNALVALGFGASLISIFARLGGGIFT